MYNILKVIMEEKLLPRKGAIARCSIGFIGLITSETPQEITYTDGNKGLAWLGIQLRHDSCIFPFGVDAGKEVVVVPGMPWSSRHPEVLGYLSDFTEDSDEYN